LVDVCLFVVNHCYRWILGPNSGLPG
jgi:hypothetical protein